MIPARRRGAALLCATLAVAGLATGCSTGAAAGSAGSGQGYLSSDGRSTRFTGSDRPAAPALSGPTLDGTTFDLAAARGKVVVLNVWGSWCPPCRQEAPSLERVYQRTKAKGVQFVGLDIRDQQDNARAFQRSEGSTYPSLFDDSGLLQARFRGRIAALAPPTTYVIDRRGRVAVRATGALTDARLDDLLGPVLAEAR